MVKIISLTPDLLTGVERMDKQHMRIAELINIIASQLQEGNLQNAIDLYKDTLLPFVQFHLKDEEEYMASVGFPELEEHKKHHEWVLKLFSDVGESLKDPKSLRQALSLLTGWLYGHVGKVDKKYGEFAKTQAC